MLALSSPSQKLKIHASGTGATALDVSIIFTERTVANGGAKVASQETKIIAPGKFDVLAPPLVGLEKVAGRISVVNIQTGVTQTVALIKEVDGVEYRLTPFVRLAAGEGFVITGSGSLEVYSAIGLLRSYVPV